MKLKNLKTLDIIMYVLTMFVASITIIVISYFILLSVMNIFNTQEYSKILIDANLYRGFYNILNVINSIALPTIIIAFIGAIPYLITSIIVFIFFIIRYIKYENKKISKMIILLAILLSAVFLVIKGVTIYPISGRYEINVNSKISEISNTEVKEFITEQMMVYNGGEYYNRILKEDYYIYNVKISHGFPDDYDGVINYKDGIKKEKRIFISDKNSDFIKNNMQNKTNEFAIKATFLWVVGDILYIVFIALTQKDLKRIVKREENIQVVPTK